MQDLIPPLLALIAASAEVNAARCASVDSSGMTVSRHSLASLAGLSRVGEGTLQCLPGLLVCHALPPCLAADYQHALVLCIALLTSPWTGAWAVIQKSMGPKF